MENSELKLVVTSSGPSDRGSSGRSIIAMLLGAALLGTALAATLLGADRGRREFPANEITRDAFLRLLEHGSRDPEVRAALVSLRRRIGRTPLDARTRALYAGLLLESAGSPEDAAVAAFHADRAADLAPVTVPVVRAAARILVRSREQQRAVELTREMFRYDPVSAASLLPSLEPFLSDRVLSPGGADAVVPLDPDAWLAWSTELRRLGRTSLSRTWLDGAYERWPDHQETIRHVAARSVVGRDWARLGELFAHRELAEEPAAAILYAYRARWKAETGDSEGARRDATRALELSGHSSAILVHAGDALLAAGEIASARRSWNRALFDLPAGPDRRSTRLGLLLRLARLESDHGQPGDALRAWRAVLEFSPDHVEARRRVEEMTGIPPQKTGRP